MGMVSPSLVGCGRLLRCQVNISGLGTSPDTHNFAHVSATLRKKFRHDVAKFCRMIHHGHTCTLESVPLGFCIAFAWCGPSSCVTHHSMRFGIDTGYQSGNWPVDCQCSTSPIVYRRQPTLNTSHAACIDGSTRQLPLLPSLQLLQRESCPQCPCHAQIH